MSATDDVKSSKRDDQMNCMLCKSPFSEPKLLPCLHTFCLGCLTKNCRIKDPKCPTCSEKFSVSNRSAFRQLPNNELAKRLVEVQKTVREQSAGTSCSACTDTTATKTGPKKNAMATVYCLDCEQSLCPGCEKIHKRLKTTSLHSLIGIEELRHASSPLEKLVKSKAQLCSQHPHERISLFCCDCNWSICTVCYVTQHKTHSCEDIGPAAERIRSQMQSNADGLKTLSKNYELDRADLSTERQRYLNNVAEVAKKIKEKAEAEKKLIDQQANELMRSLDQAKSNKLEINTRSKSWHDSHLASAEHCLQFVLDVLANGSDDDVAGLNGPIDGRLTQIWEARPQAITTDTLWFTPSVQGQSNQQFQSDQTYGGGFGQHPNIYDPYSSGWGAEQERNYEYENVECLPCLAQNSLGVIYISSKPGHIRQNAIITSSHALDVEKCLVLGDQQCEVSAELEYPTHLRY